jgi:hypothetical protein
MVGTCSVDLSTDGGRLRIPDHSVEEYDVEMEDSTEALYRMRQEARLHRRIPYNRPNVEVNVYTAERVCREAGENSRSGAAGLDMFLWNW